MQRTSGDAWSPLVETMRTLKATWPARGWSWDSRLNCVSSSFSTEFEAKARQCATGALPLEFVSASIARAPALLQEVAERAGGLRSGQLLLSAPVFNGALAFGLWWPWGDGETISFRVGLANVDSAREPYPRFRDVFNVAL